MAQNKKKVLSLRIIISLALLAIILLFTPLISPLGVYKPKIWGMPYTLVMSIFISICLVILTWFATKLHSESKND